MLRATSLGVYVLKKSNLLSRHAAHEYWIKRHQTEAGNWQAVGFQGAPRPVNDAFYACRFRALKQTLIDRHIQLKGLRVLDVGCGLGDFSRFYAVSGAEVSGVDVSPEAVEYCNASGSGTFVQASAADLATRFCVTFDIIHCFDVLYHLTDEEEWLKTLKAFAELSHAKTIWFLTEFHVGRRISDARHIVKRSVQEYRAALGIYNRVVIQETPLYWFYNAWPALGSRFPALITRVEWLGRWAAPFMNERVVLWVVDRGI